MNRLLTLKGKQTNRTSDIQNTGTALLTAIVLSLLTSNALANRPSMDDRSDIENTVEETAAPSTTAPVPVVSARPEPQSAVKNMMRYDQQTQQTQQTGDVLNLPAKEIQAGETVRIKLLDFPRRGMSMNKVQQEYGQPNQISDSIGRPPITRWIYADRVVYFEFSTVIHVVAR